MAASPINPRGALPVKAFLELALLVIAGVVLVSLVGSYIDRSSDPPEKELE